jgi:hypothetical protein
MRSKIVFIVAGILAIGMSSLVYAAEDKVDASTSYTRSFAKDVWLGYNLTIKENTPAPKRRIANCSTGETNLNGEYLEIQGKLSDDTKRIDTRVAFLVEAKNGKCTCKKATGKIFDTDGAEGIIAEDMPRGEKGVSQGKKIKVFYKTN